MAIKGSGSPMETVDEYFDMLIKSRFIEMFGDIKTNSKGWKCHKLGELGSFKTGGTPSSKHEEYYQGTIPFISTPALGPNYIDDSAAKYHISKEAIENCATTLIPAGSLIIGTRINVGQSSINKIPMCTNQDIVSMMDIDKKYDLLFLKHCLNQYIPYLDSQKKGATIKGITVELLKSVMIPEPPIDEQKQYVDFVEQVDKSKAVCKQIFQSLDNLVKSRFIEMFGGCKEKVPIGNICTLHSRIGWQALTKAEHMSSGDYMLITGTDFKNGQIDYSGSKFVSKERYEMDPNIIIQNGDVLVTKDGTIGKVAVVRDLPKPATLNAGIFVVRNRDDQFLTEFLQQCLLSTDFQRFIESVKRGATIVHLNQEKFLKYEIPVADPELQKQFVSFVQQVDKSKFVETVEPDHPAVFQNVHGFPSFGLIST